MSTSWLWWIILSRLTGSPIGSAVFLLVVFYTLDRFTLGLMPSPVRWFLRLTRESKLKRMILNNPHDRQARRELAELYVLRRSYPAAVEVLRPNLEAGDDDHATVFTMGVACLGAGHHAQGEKLLAHLTELDHDFRVGEVDFALGRSRLDRKDFAGAKEALERALKIRRGSIEGRVLLASAMTGLKDDAGAALMRDQAWNEYVSAPGFQRRAERLWAWRARPSRPAIYAVLVALVLIVVGNWVLPSLASGQSDFDSYGAPPAPLPEPVDE